MRKSYFPFLSKGDIIRSHLVGLAQMVRASDCGPEGRWFDPSIPPHIVQNSARRCFFDGTYKGIFTSKSRKSADFTGFTIFVL